MKLSAPIFTLKRRAKSLSREKQISHNDALDQTAQAEGFASWSLLASRHATLSQAGRLYSQLRPGTLSIIAARPGQGKTLLSLELGVEAMKEGHSFSFFSLEFTERQFHELVASLGLEITSVGGLFTFDGSDAICAEYIVRRLAASPKGAFVVIDYLQLLDQRRNTPDLSVQIQQLGTFARAKEMNLLFISQIDRHFDSAAKDLPGVSDLRLPNPLDLKLFDGACFLHQGKTRFVRL